MSDEDDVDTGKKPPGSRMDEERTPPYPMPPEHLPPHEVKRIERVIGRQPSHVHVAIAERYRIEGADPLVIMAQIAVDVHDLKKPVGLATKVAYWGASGIVAAIVFVAILVSNRSERDTAVEYRLRALEEKLIEIRQIVSGLAQQRYPVASAPDKDPHP